MYDYLEGVRVRDMMLRDRSKPLEVKLRIKGCRGWFSPPAIFRLTRGLMLRGVTDARIS